MLCVTRPLKKISVINSGWTKKKEGSSGTVAKFFARLLQFVVQNCHLLTGAILSYFFLTDRGESAEQYSTIRIMNDDDEYLWLRVYDLTILEFRSASLVMCGKWYPADCAEKKI